MDQVLVLSVSLCFPHRTKALVLELLAAVCLVRGGHEIILSAFDNFKEVRGAALSDSGVPTSLMVDWSLLIQLNSLQEGFSISCRFSLEHLGVHSIVSMFMLKEL